MSAIGTKQTSLVGRTCPLLEVKRTSLRAEICSAARHYLDLRLATAWRPAILPNTRARKIDTAFGAVA